MSNTIESLELEIVSNSKSAVEGIDALTQSLEKLKSATKGGLGLSAVAKDTEKLGKATKQLANSANKGLIPTMKNLFDTTKRGSMSFTDFYHKVKAIGGVIRVVGESIGSNIKKSNDYIENVNLFTVSMGEYADEAMTYAENVSEVLGIDTSDWVRAQGVFMTMATGFGVASDRAATMSQNLTALGYDLASFYNMDVGDAMDKLKSGLAGELEPLRAIGYDLSQAKLEATAAELGITKAVSAMTQAEKAQLRYYAIMTQVTVAHGDMARTLDDPANQLRVLKSQLSMAAREIGNVFIPALNAILPYAIAVVKVVRNLASNLANLVGFEMPEVDYSGVSSMGNVAEETSDAMENATDSAKKLKSYMLGFDELNVINPNTDSASEGSSATEFDFKLPTLDDFLGDVAKTKADEIVAKIEEALAGITMVLSGASLALGAILTFTGANIGLGIALMIAGAVGLGTAIAVNWGSLDNPLQTVIGTLGGIVGGGLLALGGILAFSGANIPLGIALMAVGAVSLVTALALNWDSLSEPVRQTIGTIAGIAGGALLALGAILAFSGGMIPLGIALMAAGAISLVSAVALNWGSLGKDVESAISTIGLIVSGALLGLGAVLAFTGANVPLGIALMAAGAITLATSIALNSNTLSDEVRETVALITSIVSVALLGVGAILAFTGANIPLGIALMAGGALALGTAIAPNWNTLSESVQSTITTIMTIVGAGLLGVGALFAFSGVNIPLGIGLMLAGATSLGTAVALNWESIKTALEGPVGVVTALISGALLALGAVLAFTGVALPLGIALMVAGAAGLATVVAINWNSIVDALQGPVGLITGIISGALLVLGAILLFTGVGIPLGIGLMLAGAAGLGTTVAVNWDFLVDKIKEIWDKIKEFWKTYIAPIFTAEWWSNLGKSCINGLISGFEGGINWIIGAFESMINWVVNGLNKISFDVPDWVPGIGGKTFGFNLATVSFSRVSIPRFENGGLPEQGQMFIAREAGAEMVGSIGRKTAVANNDQIVSGIAGGVAEANEEQNALLREQNSLLRALLEKDTATYIDGKSLTNSVEKYQRERGRVLITGGVV